MYGVIPCHNNRVHITAHYVSFFLYQMPEKWINRSNWFKRNILKDLWFFLAKMKKHIERKWHHGLWNMGPQGLNPHTNPSTVAQGLDLPRLLFLTYTIERVVKKIRASQAGTFPPCLYYMPVSSRVLEVQRVWNFSLFFKKLTINKRIVIPKQ